MPEQLEFSEFTFGYALTENFTRHVSVKAVPVFPSLTEEGGATGGYDVSLDVGTGLPVLLQFKVPQVVTKTSRNMIPGFPKPYYRAHLRCRSNDDGFSQHSVLLDHEGRGHVVFYATPKFHRLAQLDMLFTAGRVVDESAFFSPGDVGPLDDRQHYVSYHATSGEGWCHSEPRKLARSLDSKAFLESLATRRETSTKFSYSSLLNEMALSAERQIERNVRTAQNARIEPPAVPTVRVGTEAPRMRPREFAGHLRDRRTPRASAAIFARFVLGCELLVVQPDRSDTDE